MNTDNTQIPRNVQAKTAKSGFKINITSKSIIASAGDFSLAAGCAVAAWQIWYGTAEIESFEYSMLFMAESIGLLVLRALLLARGPENNERVSRFFGSVLITGFGLWFYGTFALIAMIFLIAISPSAALASMIVFGRRLAWGISNRPTNLKEATIVRGYWKLTHNAWFAALLVSGIISIIVTLSLNIHAGDPRENALALVGATIYFSILGVFVLVNDPRMRVHEGFDRTFADPDSLIRPYDALVSMRALVKSYFYLLPGIILTILTTFLLNSLTPLGSHDLITPVFALLGSWLLFGSAVYIQGNGRGNSALSTSIQGLIMFLRRNLLLYFALFFAFWLILILMFSSLTDYQTGDPELPYLHIQFLV